MCDINRDKLHLYNKGVCTPKPGYTLLFIMRTVFKQSKKAKTGRAAIKLRLPPFRVAVVYPGGEVSLSSLKI